MIIFILVQKIFTMNYAIIAPQYGKQRRTGAQNGIEINLNTELTKKLTQKKSFLE